MILVPIVGLLAATSGFSRFDYPKPLRHVLNQLVVYGSYYIFRPGVPIADRKYNYLWFSFALNVSVTALTGKFTVAGMQTSRFNSHLPASRIWWMARKAHKILGPVLTQKYYSAVAIVYVSPQWYCATMYIFLRLADRISQNRIWSHLLLVHSGRPNSSIGQYFTPDPPQDGDHPLTYKLQPNSPFFFHLGVGQVVVS